MNYWVQVCVALGKYKVCTLSMYRQGYMKYIMKDACLHLYVCDSHCYESTENDMKHDTAAPAGQV